MAQSDRTTGLKGNVGMKIPVRAASTAALTLSGEQTVDGVALVTGDRCLVKDQADTTTNGIYVVDTGAWSRSKDFNGSYDIVQGSIIHVNEGTSNVGSFWEIATADPITIGTTGITFTRVAAFSVSLSSQTASAGQTLINLGATYATGSQAIAVYVNGLRQRITADYTETSSSSFTMTYPLQAGDEVDVYIGQNLGNLTAAAAVLVAVTDAGDYYLGTTVEAILQEIARSVNADVGDASATLTNNSSKKIQRWNTALTANRTATLSTSNAKEGARFRIIRGSGATGNFSLAVGSLATLWAPGMFADVVYTGSAWILEAMGYLESAEVRGTTSVGDASVTLTVGSSRVEQRWANALTAERTATLATAGAWQGAGFHLQREEAAGGGFSLEVLVGTTRLIRLAPGEWADVVYNGTTWYVAASGSLRRAPSSVVALRDDFLGEEVDGTKWQSLIGTDAACRQATVRADQYGGVARLTTGADAGATMALNGAQMHSQLNWRANGGGLECEFRVAIDVITAVAVFIGLTDQRAALEMPFTLAAGDALTSNATDAVGVLFDTGADTDDWWLVGVAADVDATKQDTGAGPTAATFELWKIELDSAGNAKFYRNNVLVGTLLTGAVTPSVLLTPVVAAFARGAASRNIDLDLLNVAQQR